MRIDFHAELLSTLARLPASRRDQARTSRFRVEFYPFAQKGNVPSFARLRFTSPFVNSLRNH